MSKAFVLMLSLMLLSGAAAAQQDPDDAVVATAYATVNVRGGPGAQYEIVGRLEADDQVSVIGRDGESSAWLEVTLADGDSGWVPSFTVSLEGAVAALPIVTVEAPQEDTLRPLSATAYGQVNVRSGPGMEYEIVGQLDVDDVARIVGRSNTNNDWLYIQSEAWTGWVAYFTISIQGDPNTLPLLVVDGSGQEVVPPEAVVSARFNTRLRAEPAADSTVLEIVPFRATVTPLARTDDNAWVYVVYQDVYGWGAARLFDLTLEQVESLPIYGLDFEFIPQPQVTPNPDAEG